MPAGKYDFAIEQGSTFTRLFRFKNPNGSLMNLTGCTAKMQIRQTYASDDPLLELTTENGRIAIDGPAGEVTLTISDDDTRALSFNRGVYDLEVIPTDATTSRKIKGVVILDREATR